MKLPVYFSYLSLFALIDIITNIQPWVIPKAIWTPIGPVETDFRRSFQRPVSTFLVLRFGEGAVVDLLATLKEGVAPMGLVNVGDLGAIVDFWTDLDREDFILLSI